ncbi:MAG: nuclear transport factor 2 family protein [Hyphomonadaceae bacterium]
MSALRAATLALLLLALPPPSHAQADAAADEAAIVALERDVALVLTRDGFDAYASLFDPDFSLWIDGRLVARDAYLIGVRAWRAGGAGATATRMSPVSVEVFEDLALSRYTLREDFNDGTSFVGRFVSLARREDGRWRLFRSNVQTLYRGPSASAPDGA